MKPKLKVADYRGYARPFLRTFDLTENIEEAQCLMLTGGEDIDPQNYGEQAGRWTYANPQRDQYELEYIAQAKEMGIPVIGICRGAQMLCALNGGKLAQDVTGHTSSHRIRTIHDHEREGLDADIPMVMSSLHHQMMRPEGTDHIMVAWAERLSKHYLNGHDEEIYGKPLDREPEIVVFKGPIKGLAIQGHPEMLPNDHPAVAYCNRLVKEYLL